MTIMWSASSFAEIPDQFWSVPHLVYQDDLNWVPEDRLKEELTFQRPPFPWMALGNEYARVCGFAPSLVLGGERGLPLSPNSLLCLLRPALKCPYLNAQSKRSV